jgi:hypothetical protein
MKAGPVKRLRSLLLRGLGGGALGGFVFAAGAVLFVQPSGWDNWLGWFLIIYVAVGLPFGAFIGGIVGTIGWLIHFQKATALGSSLGALMGTIVGIVCWAIVWLLTYRSGYVEHSWPSILLGLALFGAATGGIPGALVGASGMPRVNADRVSAAEAQ